MPNKLILLFMAILFTSLMLYRSHIRFADANPIFIGNKYLSYSDFDRIDWPFKSEVVEIQCLDEGVFIIHDTPDLIEGDSYVIKEYIREYSDIMNIRELDSVFGSRADYLRVEEVSASMCSN